MKKKALSYRDPWKCYKLLLLNQIDYFRNFEDNAAFLDQVHYHMEEEFIEKGADVVCAGEACSSIIFLVHGVLELLIFDNDGNEFVLDVLKPGDIVGQYSVIFSESFLFTVRTKSNARILHLRNSFFTS
mmetsp:Transcript_26747/g.40811  ORF Transcript_26747/g.40811 Transcript_26747/m.40811 type:complete len:129 (+) Transcript_26747:524-910(+)